MKAETQQVRASIKRMDDHIPDNLLSRLVALEEQVAAQQKQLLAQLEQLTALQLLRRTQVVCMCQAPLHCYRMCAPWHGIGGPRDAPPPSHGVTTAPAAPASPRPHRLVPAEASQSVAVTS